MRLKSVLVHKGLFVSTLLVDTCSIYHLETHSGDMLCVQNVCRAAYYLAGKHDFQCVCRTYFYPGCKMKRIGSDKSGISGNVCEKLGLLSLYSNEHEEH